MVRRVAAAAVLLLALPVLSLSLSVGTAVASGAGEVTNFTDATISSPSAIVRGSDGALWFINDGDNSIGRITTTGTVTNYTDASISEPGGIATGSDGSLWFTNVGNDSIGRITTTGAVSNYTDPGLRVPVEIASGSDGALWFTYAGPGIGRITTSGKITLYTGTGITGPVGITAGPDGALWFTNDVNDYSIGRITTTGTVTSYTDASISSPYAIAAGPDGALWFTNTGNNSIGRITTTGTVTNYTDASISEPEGIATAPDGAIWFTNIGAYSIGRITTTGTVTNYTDASISEPGGIATGPDGAVWFTNFGNNSIGRITVAMGVPGAPTGVTATPANASATVSWTAPASNGSPISSYAVFCASSDGGGIHGGSGAANPVLVSALTNGKTYRCAVTATNGVGTSVPSVPSNSFVPATVPGVPTSTSALPGNTQATVKWTAPASNGGVAVSSYVVTPFVAGVAQSARTFNSSATTETVTGLTNTKSYTFKIAAKNDVGTGIQSVATSPILVGLPTAPTNVIAVGNMKRAAVRWTVPVSNGGAAISGYVVTPYRAGVAQHQWVFASISNAETITGLTNGVKYTFKVAALNANGTGLQSAPDTPIAIGAPTVPSTPLSPSAVPGNGQATLTWTAPVSNGSANITGYIVTPYIGGVAQPIRAFNANTTQIVTGLTNGTSYTFKIAAGNSAGTSPQSVASNTVTPT